MPSERLTPETLAEIAERWDTSFWRVSQALKDVWLLFSHVEALTAENAALRKVAEAAYIARSSINPDAYAVALANLSSALYALTDYDEWTPEMRASDRRPDDEDDAQDDEEEDFDG